MVLISENLVSEKGLGFGDFVSEKSFSFGKFGLKKVSVLVSENLIPQKKKSK